VPYLASRLAIQALIYLIYLALETGLPLLVKQNKKDRLMRNNKNRETKINTCITVSADECRGDAEKMVRKFSKKVKKDGIIDEYRDRTHFKKNSIKRTEKKRAKKRLIEKVNRRAKELLNPRSSRLRTRRN